MTSKYQGRCHCGLIRIEFATAREPKDFVPRADDCGFCVRHRALAISDPSGSMILTLPEGAAIPYRFGLNITDFYVCNRCGVWVAAIWHDDARAFGVVNVPALDDRAMFSATPVRVDFDAEDVPAREARRRAHWTPAQIVTSDDHTTE